MASSRTSSPTWSTATWRRATRRQGRAPAADRRTLVSASTSMWSATVFRGRTRFTFTTSPRRAPSGRAAGHGCSGSSARGTGEVPRAATADCAERASRGTGPIRGTGAHGASGGRGRVVGHRRLRIQARRRHGGADCDQPPPLLEMRVLHAITSQSLPRTAFAAFACASFAARGRVPRATRAKTAAADGGAAVGTAGGAGGSGGAAAGGSGGAAVVAGGQAPAITGGDGTADARATVGGRGTKPVDARHGPEPARARGSVPTSAASTSAATAGVATRGCRAVVRARVSGRLRLRIETAREPQWAEQRQSKKCRTCHPPLG